MVKDSELSFVGGAEKLYTAGKIFEEVIEAEGGLLRNPNDESKHIITFEPEEQELASKPLNRLFSGLGLNNQRISLVVAACEKSQANPYGYVLEVRPEVNEAFGIDYKDLDDGLKRFPRRKGIHDPKDPMDVINRGHIVQPVREYHASTGFIGDFKGKPGGQVEHIFKAFSSPEKFGLSKGLSPKMTTTDPMLQEIIADLADFTKQVIAKRVQCK